MIIEAQFVTPFLSLATAILICLEALLSKSADAYASRGAAAE